MRREEQPPSSDKAKHEENLTPDDQDNASHGRGARYGPFRAIQSPGSNNEQDNSEDHCTDYWLDPIPLLSNTYPKL